MFRKKTVFFATIAALVGASPLSGAFYMRLKWPAEEKFIAAGAVEAGHAEAVVNGVVATIQTVIFDKSVNEALADLRRLWPTLPDFADETAANLSGARISCREGGERLEMIFLPAANVGESVAWIVRRNLHTGVPEPFPCENPLPSARLRSWIHNKTSGVLLSDHESSGGERSLLREAASSLAAEGWRVAIAAGKTVLMTRDGSLALIAARKRNGKTYITVVRRL